MISRSTDLPIVAFSVRLYQLLLVAYPSRFQQEYGSHMSQVFLDCCLRAFRQNGPKGLIKLWFITLLDLAQSVIAEHMQKDTQLKKEIRPEDIRRAGWALILGAIFLVFSIVLAILTEDNGSLFALELLVFISLPLLVYGVLGLRNRYGEKTGSFGRSILLIGAIFGPITSIVGFFLATIDPFWILTWAGPAVLFVCLTLFGVVALHKKPMPRWNILPVIAGLSYPAIIVFYIITEIIPGDLTRSSISTFEVVTILLVFIQCIALLALGTILKADVPNETAVIA
jgi:hypothetical protein